MTTIITDGKFLIADHRMSITHPNGTEAMDIANGCSTKSAISDSLVKIKLCTEETQVYCRDDRIVAYALAGSTSVCIGFRNWVARQVGRCSIQTFLDSNYSLGNAPNATMIAVAANGNMHHIDFVTGQTSYSGPTITICRGSGMSGYNFLMNEYTEFFRNLTLEERFLMAAMLDEHSSMSYSVYSIKDAIFYPFVLVKQEQIDERRKDLMARWAAASGGKKHVGGSHYVIA